MENQIPCLLETGSWMKASWLTFRMEVMLLGRGKHFEELMNFMTAPSPEGTCLTHCQSRCNLRVSAQGFSDGHKCLLSSSEG